MTQVRHIALCLGALVLLPGLTSVAATPGQLAPLKSQPLDERKQQDPLPKSHDKMWDLLASTKIRADTEKGLYKAEFPDAVKKLNGQTVTISGFVLPLEPTDSFKHFLLSKRTPTCPFCPPGEPNEVVEVYTSKDITWVDELTTYTGTFKLSDQEEAGIFFVLTDASKK